MPLLEQGVEGLKEFGHVVDVQSGRRFVKNEEGVTLSVPPGEEGGELDALRFAAAERVGSLTEGDVAKADVLEGLEFGKKTANGGRRLPSFFRRKKQQGVIHGHAQDVVHVLALVGDLKDVVLEPLASAVLTNQLEVGHELHAHRHVAFSFARFATSARNVEAEVGGLEASCLGMGGVRQERADFIEGLDVGDRIGARAFANRVLVHKLQMLQGVHVAFEGSKALGFATKPIEFSLDGGNEQLRDEGAFARTTDSAHRHQAAQGHHGVKSLKVVGADLPHPQFVPYGPALGRHRNGLVAVAVGGGQRGMPGIQFGQSIMGPAEHNFPTK